MTDKPAQSVPMKLFNAQHVEVLKVWYALFTTLMDSYEAGEYEDRPLIEKFKILRRRLDAEVPIDEIKSN